MKVLFSMLTLLLLFTSCGSKSSGGSGAAPAARTVDLTSLLGTWQSKCTVGDFGTSSTISTVEVKEDSLITNDTKYFGTDCNEKNVWSASTNTVQYSIDSLEGNKLTLHLVYDVNQDGSVRNIRTDVIEEVVITNTNEMVIKVVSGHYIDNRGNEVEIPMSEIQKETTTTLHRL